MSLVCSSSSAVPTSVIAHLKFQREILGPSCFITRYKFPSVTTKNIHSVFHTPFTVLSSVRDYAETGYQPFTEETMSFDWEDLEEIEDADSPWEGAVIYKRNLSVTHIEYCTTLERLGLGKLSTEISKSKASVMGLLVTKAVKDYPNGTPVLVSIDMTRKKQKLRLDGIIRTVITLGCNRCGEPAAECVFSNLSLLLCEEPIEELDIINLGLKFGEDKFKSFDGVDQEDDDDEASIDWDDRLYFPQCNLGSAFAHDSEQES